jgi:gamma-butyrobetaine dioxygenase
VSAVLARAAPCGAELVGEHVRVAFDGGGSAEFHRLALRDGCRCSDCRHPVSGQRLFETTDVLPAARIVAIGLEEETLTVEWADGHRSTFEAAWLAAETQAAASGRRTPRALTLWGAELSRELPSASYTDLLADPDEFGFALVTAAPVEEGIVASVAELFGPVHETNYGRVFDVTVRAEARNLADTARALSLHTDNPYRAPAPSLQLLHCLTSSASGGETVLADGFRAVARLAVKAPRKLALLSSQPIRFSYRDEYVELSADVPVVVLDGDGLPVALHVNNRAKDVPVGTPEGVAEWYEAYFALLSLLERPEAEVVLRLEPGQLIAFDNLRVLHGRRGFSGEGVRRLQGCYADRDALLSRLAVLERRPG